jgi:hypothetical protein
MPTLALEHVAGGETSPHLELPAARSRRFRYGGPQRGGGVRSVVRALRGKQQHGFGLEFLIAELAGEGIQLFGGPADLIVMVFSPQRPAQLSQDLCAHPGRSSRQVQRRPQVIELTGEQQFPAQARTPQQQAGPPLSLLAGRTGRGRTRPGPGRTGPGRTGLGQRRLHQGQATLGRAGPARRVRRNGEHADVVGTGVPGGIPHLAP